MGKNTVHAQVQGRWPPAMEVTQIVGDQTRSRSAAGAVSERREAPDPSLEACSESGSCGYLKLRSRMLAPPPASMEETAPASQDGALAAGLSRCSSTAALDEILAGGAYTLEGSASNWESGLESDPAGQKSSGPWLAAIQEAEEFFAAAEEAEAKRFAAKYNFDFIRGVPLDAGRFEWAPAIGSS